MVCQWEKARLPAGAKSTNDVLTHKAICYLDDAIYQIAYAEMTMACAEYHMRKWHTARQFYCTDKSFATITYEDNGGEKIKCKTERQDEWRIRKTTSQSSTIKPGLANTPLSLVAA